jgi:hypothetical protein
MFIRNNNTQQQEQEIPAPVMPPPPTSSYFSRICSLVTWKSFTSASSASLTSISSSSSFPQAEKLPPIDQDYYFVKHSIPNSVQATLNLINKLSINWSDLCNELQIVKDNLYLSCHQFDNSKLVDQFANTDKKIGVELKLYINFVSERYSCCSSSGSSSRGSDCLALMGLLMIGTQILKTSGEVKSQLVYTTKIGRDLILAMDFVLHQQSKTHLPSELKCDILEIVLEKEDSWFPVLKNICFEFADYDLNWEFREKYYGVVSLATQLLLDD